MSEKGPDKNPLEPGNKKHKIRNKRKMIIWHTMKIETIDKNNIRNVKAIRIKKS